MATPNMPSSAQDIINNFLSGGYASQAQANPYRVDVDPFRPPVDTPEEDKSPTDPCPEGYVYDPVIKSCVPIQDVSSDSDRPEEIDRDKMIYDQMKRDTSTVFGASNTLDDYLIDTKGGSDILLRFDPNTGKPTIPFMPLASAGLGLLDSFFGGDKRRQNRFNDALQTYTDAGYGQQLNNGTYQVFNPQQYYSNVMNDVVSGARQTVPPSMGGSAPVTVGQAVNAVMGNDYTGISSGGSPIAQDMSGGLLGRTPLTSTDSQGNRTRNDDAYKAAVARNIKRNEQNSPYGTSGFSMNVGGTGMAGFNRGR